MLYFYQNREDMGYRIMRLSRLLGGIESSYVLTACILLCCERLRRADIDVTPCL